MEKTGYDEASFEEALKESNLQRYRRHQASGERFFWKMVIALLVVLAGYSAFRAKLFLIADEGRNGAPVASVGNGTTGDARNHSILRRFNPPDPLVDLVRIDTRGEVIPLSQEDLSWYVGVADSERLQAIFGARNLEIGRELDALDADLSRLARALPSTVSFSLLRRSIERGWELAAAPGADKEMDSKERQNALDALATLQAFESYRLRLREEAAAALKNIETQIRELEKRRLPPPATTPADTTGTLPALPAVPSITHSPAAPALQAPLSAAEWNTLKAQALDVTANLELLRVHLMVEGSEPYVTELKKRLIKLQNALDARQKTDGANDDTAQALADALDELREFMRVAQGQSIRTELPPATTRNPRGGSPKPVATKEQATEVWPGTTAIVETLGDAAKEWRALHAALTAAVATLPKAPTEHKPACPAPPAGCPCLSRDTGKTTTPEPKLPDITKQLKTLARAAEDLRKILDTSLFLRDSASSATADKAALQSADQNTAFSIDKLRGVLVALETYLAPRIDPLLAFRAFEAELTPEMKQAAGAALLGDIESRLARWQRLRDRQLLEIEALRSPRKFSFFLVSPPGVLVDMAFWSLLGVITNILLGTAEYLRQGTFRRSEQLVGVSKVLYGPILACVIGLCLAIGIINLGEYQIRVWVLPIIAFLLGYASRRTAYLVDRLSAKVLDRAGASLDEEFSTIQNHLLASVAKSRITSIPELRRSLKELAALQVAEALKRRAK